MLGFTLLLAIAGVTLVYSGFKGLDPRSIVASVFTGQAATPIPGSDALNPTAGASLPGISGTTCNDNVPLARYRNMRLQPSAIAAFKRAEQVYGGIIVVGGTYRTCAYQEQQHASNPGRFTDAASSAHVKGLAIDTIAVTAKARAALLKVGWCQSRSDEPWHFSWSVCA